MVLSPDRRTLAVVTGSNFNPRALHLIDVDTQTLKQTISIANSFVGVAFSPAGETDLRRRRREQRRQAVHARRRTARSRPPARSRLPVRRRAACR